MQIQAVIFDLFGTLVNNFMAEERIRSRVELASILDAPLDELDLIWNRSLKDRDQGIYGGVEEDIRFLCNQLGLSPDLEIIDAAVESRLNTYRRLMIPRPGTLETLHYLKRSGLKTGLLSDCGYEIPRIWNETPFVPVIDAPTFSCEVKLLKPDPAIFNHACSKLGVLPEECLFVGDGGSRELTGARKSGLHPILIRVDYDHDYDIHRPDALEWEGPRISNLTELMEMLY